MEETTLEEQNAAAAQAAGSADSEASIKKPESVIQHKCPSCGAPLLYSPKEEAAVCEYCGGTFALSELKDTESETEKQFDWGEYKKKLSGEKLKGTLTYECGSCGAVIETPKITMATICPYCSNNIVLKNSATGGLKPNLIIPFVITKDKVKSILREVAWNKKLLPFNYFNSCKIGDIQGIYVPYWLFSSKIAGSVTIHGEKSKTSYSTSSYTTRTSVYALKRSGSLEISRLPVDASVKIDNEMMDSIEPFDYSKITEFDSKYLAGFLADRFDSPPDAELPRAQQFMMSVAESKFDGTAPGYTSTCITGNNLNLVNPGVEYALFPVYLVNCEFEGKTYRYAINGQTGKFVGEFPVSAKKKRFLTALSFMIPFSILYGILLFIQIFF
ncbi:MAG: hypothetical protein IKZ86_14445 [Spirochaetaceae bacterium]|nr:hypothetical protein [Spirochaetaceae bacterium]